MNLWPLKIVDADVESWTVFAWKNTSVITREMPSQLPEEVAASTARALAHKLRDAGWLVRVGKPAS